MNDIERRKQERQDEATDAEINRLALTPRDTAMQLISARIVLRIAAERLAEYGDRATVGIIEHELEE